MEAPFDYKKASTMSDNTKAKKLKHCWDPTLEYGEDCIEWKFGEAPHWGYTGSDDEIDDKDDRKPIPPAFVTPRIKSPSAFSVATSIASSTASLSATKSSSRTATPFTTPYDATVDTQGGRNPSGRGRGGGNQGRRGGKSRWQEATQDTTRAS